jgi:hypothetical protein
VREVTSSSAHALVSFAVAASLALLDRKDWCQVDREQLGTLLNASGSLMTSAHSTCHLFETLHYPAARSAQSTAYEDQ